MLAASGGTILVILGTAPTRGTTRPRTPVVQPLLESRPMASIGRYSYSWYLWHWPAFVLTLAAFNGTRIWAQIACVVSIVPAIVAFHLVEQPVRLSPSLRASWRRSLMVGAVLVVVGAVVSIGLVGWGGVRMRDPEIARMIAAEESFVTAGCRFDSERFGVRVCLGGSDAPDAPTVLLVGDSHASQWAAAYSRLGERSGVAIAVRASGSCPAAGLRTREDGEPQAYISSCAEFQRENDVLIGSGRFAAVITSDAVGSRPSDAEEWFEGMVRLTDIAAEADTPLAMMIDNPHPGEVLQCLSRRRGESTCLAPRSEATSGIREFQPSADRLTAEKSVPQLDLTDAICPDDPCPVEIDGVIVPARAGHLNRDFTYTQIPALTEFLGSRFSVGTGQ